MPIGTPVSQEDRESILSMKSRGITNENIAAIVGISVKTVSTILVMAGVQNQMGKFKRAPEIKSEVKYIHPEEYGMDENWETEGLCRTGGYDPDLWFPSPTEFSLIKLAQKVCYRCPVIMECRTTAIARGEKNGIWGGLTELQRRRMRRGTRASEEIDDREEAMA